VKAAEAFREARRLGSGDPAIAYNLAFAWHQAGRKEEALQALKLALREDPFSERLRSLLQEMDR